MDVEIRQATADDSEIIALAVVMAIGEDSAKMYCGEHYMEALQEVAKLKDSQYSYLNALVATVGRVAVGAIIGYDGDMLQRLRDNTLAVVRKYNPDLVVLDDETDGNEFYLDSICVLPEYRCHGIGRMLLMAMRDKAFAAGYKTVGLLVDYENPDAERLYVSLGFESVGDKMFCGHRMRHLQSRRNFV